MFELILLFADIYYSERKKHLIFCPREPRSASHSKHCGVMQSVAMLNMGAAGAHVCLAQSHGASVSVKLQQVTGAPEAEHYSDTTTRYLSTLFR